MNGGYIMIDCMGLDLTKGDTPQVIDGIYATVSTAMSTGKPMIAVSCMWDDAPITPISVFAIQTGTNQITVTSSTLQVIISVNDSIVIHSMV